jgi:ATP-binding cassette, subfamily A (ABC1), member 3
MDEADILGDRIAIMSEGTLRTVGSSFFLKKTFGTGYKLICEKDALCDSNLILDVLREYASDAQIESDTQGEVVFNISEQYLTIFHYIFKKLEDEAGRLRISSFGCNLSTLEEIFLKLGTETHHEDDNIESMSEMDATGSTMIFLNDFNGITTSTGLPLILNQMVAIIMKKLFYLRENYLTILYLTVITILAVTLEMQADIDDDTPAPPLVISLDVYADSITLVEADKTYETYRKSFLSLLSGKDTAKEVDDDMVERFLRISNESLSTAQYEILIGASFEGDGFTAWFNGEPYHTMPLALNMMNRAILRNLFGAGFDIHLTNKPFNWTRVSEAESEARNNAFSIVPSLIGLFLLLVYWPMVFIGFYIKERVSRFKLLQFITGANRATFWATSLLFDFVVFFLVICAILAGLSLHNIPNLSTFDDLSSLLLILAYYAFAVLPFTYAFSFLFSKPSSGENYLILFGFLSELRVF